MRCPVCGQEYSDRVGDGGCPYSDESPMSWHFVDHCHRAFYDSRLWVDDDSQSIREVIYRYGGYEQVFNDLLMGVVNHD